MLYNEEGYHPPLLFGTGPRDADPVQPAARASSCAVTSTVTGGPPWPNAAVDGMSAASHFSAERGDAFEQNLLAQLGNPFR